MQTLSADLDTDNQPPLSLPFAHFVVGVLVLLVGGAIAGLGPLVASVQASGAGTIHLLLAGWVGLTIMGAMTQFVPVWSGTALHSRRLSVASMWLVTVGVIGLFLGFFLRSYTWLPGAAAVLLVGFWTFGYNIARTLPAPAEMDITEAHFAFALCCLLAATVLGTLLATDYAVRYLPAGPLSPSGVVLSHLTLTVFGFVLATIIGALYQLAPMFTQAEATALDTHLAHVEMVAFPGGVALLAAGRLFSLGLLATLGALWVLLGVAAFTAFFARRLVLARVERGPMLRRYALVAASLGGWVVLTAPWWATDPLSFFGRFGSPAATHLLFVGVLAFTIVGTFYHVVPFIVWYHRYSDKLGYEPVPMVDDLYNERLATAEFWLLAVGLGGLWLGDLLGEHWVLMAGGNLLGVGILLFVVNVSAIVWHHRPETVREVLATLAGQSR